MAQVINNFELLGRFIERQVDKDDFWFLQVIKRRKDNPGLSRNEKMIENFFIKGKEDLFDKRERIIEVCEANNARAYFRVNRRNYKKVALYMMKNLADHIATSNWKDCRNVFLRTSGQYHSEERKTWIVDVDEGENIQRISDIIEGLHEERQLVNPLYMLVPTVTGWHLVTSPFDIKRFTIACPGVEVHKDNPTLLYFKKLDNEETADSVLNECCVL